VTGAEHYAEAERLIGVARGDFGDMYDDTPAVMTRLAEAQVHATLAQVVANAEVRFTTPQQARGGVEHGSSSDHEWSEVIR
jgi:hypothetical protein